MPTTIGNAGQIYDTASGRIVGFLDRLGRESYVPAMLTAFSATERTEVLSRAAGDPVRAAFLLMVESPSANGTPALSTLFSGRAGQSQRVMLIDQGPAMNVMPVNSGLVPVAWAASQAVSLTNYRTPTNWDGRYIYRVTTAGTNAASEPTWSTTLAGTTTSGTAVYTTEKGPYYTHASGVQMVRSLASTQTGQASVWQVPASPAGTWNMQTQSVILHLRPGYDWNASGQAAASPIFSNSASGTGPGIRLLATGGSLQDIRVQVRDATNNVLSGNMGLGFARKPMDGTIRSVVLMVDGPTKIMYFYIDGLPVLQADMFDGNNLTPNGMNLATITGSTAGSTWTVGGDPGAAASFEFGFSHADITVLNSGLPVNLTNIAQWYARGGQGVLPQSLVQ